MKWHVKLLYVKAMTIVVTLAGLVAAAAAGWKWR